MTTSNDKKIEAIGPFIIVLILLLVSVGLLIVGLSRSRFQVRDVAVNLFSQENDNESDESLGKYFEEEFSKSETSASNQDFLGNDPFKGICEGASGESSVTSNTVCFY